MKKFSVWLEERSNQKDGDELWTKDELKYGPDANDPKAMAKWRRKEAKFKKWAEKDRKEIAEEE